MKALGQRVEECMLSKRLLQLTVAVSGRTSIVQGLGNLSHLARRPSVAGLDGTFAGKPCVIVSPGPSLSRNLHLLPRLKGRALLLTCTHALRSFRSVGVHPDFVLAADAGDLARQCEGYDLSRIEGPGSISR